MFHRRVDHLDDFFCYVFCIFLVMVIVLLWLACFAKFELEFPFFG